MGILHKFLAHPLTKGLSVDDPITTVKRREIIYSKTFLTAIYNEWYHEINKRLPIKESILELGSGAGFFSEHVQGLITSEVFRIPGVQIIADACSLPFADDSLNAIVMTDVFHHIPDVHRFLSEAARCIRPNGKIVMIEPWRTTWSELIYKRLHSEPFVVDSDDWQIPSFGPLSGANGALPWIVFERDRAEFKSLYPFWDIIDIKLLMPFSYLVSGGVSMRGLVPGFLYKYIRKIEASLDQKKWAMFAVIELELKH
ncbi:class I SAM-dependent methyltransferase [Aquella oligotrophica]|uniref:Methyltransferase type 11 n=1 Tax=Aquella oligotrophica TaxID=2067065 RepID=A0A2I7N9L1_9NEIS|nr:class I SAM-dependent methyltransferase [Aquella oligotrophica]AUR53126.1 methyltransferase type 11 [Aquella oligotrophica]